MGNAIIIKPTGTQVPKKIFLTTDTFENAKAVQHGFNLLFQMLGIDASQIVQIERTDDSPKQDNEYLRADGNPLTATAYIRWRDGGENRAPTTSSNYTCILYANTEYTITYANEVNNEKVERNKL